VDALTGHEWDDAGNLQRAYRWDGVPVDCGGVLVWPLVEGHGRVLRTADVDVQTAECTVGPYVRVGEGNGELLEGLVCGGHVRWGEDCAAEDRRGDEQGRFAALVADSVHADEGVLARHVVGLPEGVGLRGVVGPE